jgi:hypothetical protein
LTDPIEERGSSIEASGDFHAHPRSTTLHTRKKTDIHFTRWFSQYTHLGEYSRRAQSRQTLTCD